MDNTPLFFGVGCLIGIVLFFVCERLGLLHKWSGLKDPRMQSVAKNSEEKRHESL